MSAPFTLQVLRYCLGKGKMRLLGARSRPWLEIIRSETESAYLGHQLRSLQRLHPGPLRSDWDTLPTQGYYDLVRVRLHSPLLWRAYELLYPQDRRRLSAEVLAMTGLAGLAALWCDGGERHPRHGQLNVPGLRPDAYLVKRQLEGLGIRVDQPGVRMAQQRLILGAEAMNELAKLLRPLTHRSMRHVLRKPDSARPRGRRRVAGTSAMKE